MDKIILDFNNIVKDMKPVNGVTNGPGVHKGVLDSSRFFKELDLPLSRLHDTEMFSRKHFVDYNKIFSDILKDENDPSAYDFKGTDELIAKLESLGIDIIFRLGSSAAVNNKKIHNEFPCDIEKLSQIMFRIVDHYCGKWADGYEYKNIWFEIWNEPDLEIFYKGSEEKFRKFYELTSKKIKSAYPDIKVGGCAFCRVDCDFSVHVLDYIKEHSCPLDFLSYHFYNTDAFNFRKRNSDVRKLLDERGFTDIPMVLDEWNFNINFNNRLFESYLLLSSNIAACFVGSMLAELQKNPIDYAAYYDMQSNYMMFVYNGIYGFNGCKLYHKKPYYPFLYFKKLKELKKETYISDLKNVFTLAASDGMIGRCMITNYSFENPAKKEIGLEVNKEYKKMSVFVTNKYNRNKLIYSGDVLSKWNFDKNSIYYMEFEK